MVVNSWPHHIDQKTNSYEEKYKNDPMKAWLFDLSPIFR